MISRKNQKLKVLSLGNWSDVNQNLFVYENEKDILIVDCGVGFVEESESEGEIIIPDVSYLQDRQDKIRGLIITHGHFDHFGALPFVLPKIGYPPVFAINLVKGFIEARMKDFGMTSAKIHPINPEGKALSLASFKISFFRVNHSVPDSLGLCLETSAGRIFHVSDFKFDLTPVDGKVFQIGRAARLAYPQVLALFSDCLGAVTPGFTSSEREIANIFNQIMGEAKKQVFITTVSSNISRFQQAIEVSLQHNRKVVPVGRSIEEKIKIARQLGYLRLSERNILPLARAKRLPSDRLTYLIAGSYGQPNSALARLAEDKYHRLSLEEGAVVIFSADPAPPGSKETTDNLVDKLTLKGAKVHYYEIQENLHVSGHGSANDIRLLFSLVKPKYFIPIGGNPRHIRAFSFLAKEMGAKRDQIFELFNGEVLQFSQNQLKVIDKIKTKEILVKSR
jgi:ribonuclease J